VYNKCCKKEKALYPGIKRSVKYILPKEGYWVMKELLNFPKNIIHQLYCSPEELDRKKVES